MASKKKTAKKSQEEDSEKGRKKDCQENWQK